MPTHINTYDSNASYKKETFSSKTKKRLQSISKERSNETISQLYAKHRSPELKIDEGEIDMHIDKGPLSYRKEGDLAASLAGNDLKHLLNEITDLDQQIR